MDGPTATALLALAEDLSPRVSGTSTNSVLEQFGRLTDEMGAEAFEGSRATGVRCRPTRR